MNISKPDTNSEVYQRFIQEVRSKVGRAEVWLIEHKIDYIWNYWAGNHLYRLYIPSKDLLLDFEYYPVNNYEYNYIRINFDMDVIKLLNGLFTDNVIDTQELDVWNINQKRSNRFCRENNSAPIYDRSTLRLALVKENTIYQSIVLKDNRIISNVVKSGWSVPYGTYILLRYLNEMLGISEILIKDTASSSYSNIFYQIIGATAISKTDKKKIWWSPSGAKWHIKREDTDKYIPFYYCESVIYKYG